VFGGLAAPVIMRDEALGVVMRVLVRI